jgi:signal peptidase I
MHFTLLVVFVGLFVWIVSNMGIETALAFATVASGVVWLLYKLRLLYPSYPRDQLVEEKGKKILQMPPLIDYARSFFPIFLVVILLRGFVVEPFRIPSGSMMPTLLVGDFILVNKFSYGLRLPVTKSKIMDIGNPERGDVVVFRYPQNPSVDYIKRLVGLPGDVVSYKNKVLTVNHEPVQLAKIGTYQPVGSGEVMRGSWEVKENLTGVEHSILIDPRRPDFGPGCQVLANGEITVPEGHYFMMGDNRDNSNDSRCWKFVPEANLVGKAFMIWLSWDWKRSGFVEWRRSGNFIK